MTIKKAYIEIIELLEANENKKVSTILDEVRALCTAKRGGGSEVGRTFHKNEDGETIAVFCYYFKRWMPTQVVDFGVKKNTASGLNTMCKEGNSLWTKQQRIAKNAKDQLLEDLSEGLITVEDLPARQEEIEEERNAIAEPSFETHYETLEECLAFIETQA